MHDLEINYRTCRDLNTLGDEVLGVSGCVGSPLTELLQVLHLQKSTILETSERY